MATPCSRHTNRLFSEKMKARSPTGHPGGDIKKDVVVHRLQVATRGDSLKRSPGLSAHHPHLRPPEPMQGPPAARCHVAFPKASSTTQLKEKGEGKAPENVKTEDTQLPWESGRLAVGLLARICLSNSDQALATFFAEL